MLAALELLRKRLAERAATAETAAPALSLEEKTVKRELERLTGALAKSDEPSESIVNAIAERERRLRGIRTQLEAIRTSPIIIDREIKAVEQEARTRLKEFYGLLSRNPAEARQVVAAVLDGPLTFTPTEVGGNAATASRAKPAGR